LKDPAEEEGQHIVEFATKAIKELMHFGDSNVCFWMVQ